MKIYNQLVSIFGMSFVAAGLLFGGCNDDDKLEGVDLRYEDVGKLTMKDQYTITADGKNTVDFRVKSDHPWKVYGTQDWYTISPAEGPANEVAIVKITCKANTELDDRSDIINIQSDYWVGKSFTLFQKGIAYLRADDVSESGLYHAKEEGTATFVVSANQKWTAEVVEGANWLKIVENGKYEGTDKVDNETTVKLSFTANKGEERVGKVTLYDRNHSEETKVDIICTQYGITLVPVIPEIGYYKVTDYQASEIEIPVESNGEWSVSREDEKDTWYNFEIVSEENGGGTNTSCIGNGVIKVRMATNDTDKVRVANLVLKTQEVEGAEVVMKVVPIKQANLPQPERISIDAGGVGSWEGTDGISLTEGGTSFSNAQISKAGFKPGTFKLQITSMADNTSAPYLFLEYIAAGEKPQHEIRIKLNDVGRPYWTFVTPWGYGAPQVNTWCLNNIGNLDVTREHTLELRLTQNGDEDAIKIEYVFDGVLCHYYITNGKNGTCSVNGVALTGAYVQPYKSTMRVKIGNATGSAAVLDWFEYTPNIDWGD